MPYFSENKTNKKLLQKIHFSSSLYFVYYLNNTNSRTNDELIRLSQLNNYNIFYFFHRKTKYLAFNFICISNFLDFFNNLSKLLKNSFYFIPVCVLHNVKNGILNIFSFKDSLNIFNKAKESYLHFVVKIIIDRFDFTYLVIEEGLHSIFNYLNTK